jgi:hypothetical protein
MSVPNNTVRTREFTFAFEPKPNPKTGSEDQVMDKIPAALQHKIDYINALDITARQKAVRTSTEIIDYWADYYKRRNLFIDTGSFESLGDLIFSENKGNNLGYNADSLGLALGSKPSRIIPPELSVSSVPCPRAETDPTGYKKAINEGNKPDKFAYQLSCCLWVGSFVLCGLIGLVLGVAFGSSL